MNDHDARAVGKLYAQDAVAYDPFFPEPLRGPAAIEKDAANFIRAFPDLKMTITQTIEQDERSGAAELRFTGTHDGPLTTPMGDIPATHRKMDLRGAGFVKVNEKGEITEERRYYDSGQIMQQLGLV
ncbi:MAG: ester cyclase, partial [Candidatus Limnocylindria bacterium]